MSDPSNIDPSLRDFIKDEADRARGEAIADTDRLRRDFKVAGIVITPLLALAAFFGIPTLINNAVEKAMKEYAIKEVSERAEEISKNLEETNDKAGMLLNNITEAANKVAEEKRLFLEELVGLGIETRRYRLNLPQRQGTYSYETGLKKTKFEAAIVSSWRLSGARCSYSDLEETWRIKVTKPLGCPRLDVRIVYLPTAIVKKAYDSVTLNPIR
jgi:hypothetical protein